jgi:Concanavalin A-like lectin/glucanases superfamily
MRVLARSAVAALLVATGAGAQPTTPVRGPALSGHGPAVIGSYGPAAAITTKAPFNVAAYAVLVFEADSVAGADGSEILAWPNTGSMGASGNATGTSGTAPKLYANVVNGHAVARFTVNRQIVSAPDPGASGGIAVIAVVWHSAASSYPMLLSTGATLQELRCSGATLRPEWYCGASVVSGPAISLNAWNLFEGTHDGTTARGWLNGTAWGSSATAMPASGPVTVGNRAGAFAYQFLGDMAAMVIANKALSVADRQSVEGYLAWKYGIEGNLPPTHPYKWSPP